MPSKAISSPKAATVSAVGLNDKQLKAVQHTEGPLLILAGAGSGKTKALTHRIAHLITRKSVPATSILAVTFTNKAAGEMRERVKQLLTGSSRDMPFIGTFHAFGVRMLRYDADKLGYAKNFAIYDDQDQIATIKNVLAELSLDPKQFNPRLILSLISRAKNEMQTPKQAAEAADEFLEEVVAKVYARYQELLKESNAVDFDDLLVLPVRLLKEHKDVLERYQKIYRYIHIDEYQDTNHTQYTLIKLLAGKTRNVAVVGDDWQAIYGWRGASLRNILEFEKDYPDAKIVLLEQNYRSTQKILDAAGAVIAKNEDQKKKKLWTENEAGDQITVHEARDERDEADYVLRSVQKMQRQGVSLNDMVVLYRTNAQSRPVEEACLQQGIPYRIVGGIRFYDRKEVKDVMAYLKFLTNPKDNVSFERIINTPTRGLGARTRDRVHTAAVTKHGSDLFAAMLDATNNTEIDAVRAAAVRELGLSLHKIREGIADRKIKRVSEVIDLILRQFGFEKYLRDGSDEGEMRYENVRELRTVAGNQESLDGFLEQVALVSDIDKLDDGQESLTLMTTHGAKGLEFSQVFVIGMEEGVFPHSRSLLEPKELAEERRLCYVAMTRAKERLTMVHTAFRHLYGEAQSNTHSRFLEDIPEEFCDRTVSEGLDHDSRPGHLDGSSSDIIDEPFSDEVGENPFSAGEKVRHPSFGTGKVTGVEDDLVEITFDKGGSKTLSVNFAPLEKVV